MFLAMVFARASPALARTSFASQSSLLTRKLSLGAMFSVIVVTGDLFSVSLLKPIDLRASSSCEPE